MKLRALANRLAELREASFLEKWSLYQEKKNKKKSVIRLVQVLPKPLLLKDVRYAYFNYTDVSGDIQKDCSKKKKLQEISKWLVAGDVG